MRDLGPTEVGAFAITPADDLLLVEDIRLVRQTCTTVSVAFDDVAVAEFFDEQVDAGRRPGQFGRIWAHTHPAGSADPSYVDEQTFARVFGACDWALMFILSRSGTTYCRLRFSAGPGGSLEIPVEVDWKSPFTASDLTAWTAEYEANVRPAEFERRAESLTRGRSSSDGLLAGEFFDDFWDPTQTGVLYR